MLVLFVFSILNLVIILLVSNIFFLDPFIKVLFVFNLVFQVQFVIYSFFQLGPYYFDF